MCLRAIIVIRALWRSGSIVVAVVWPMAVWLWCVLGTVQWLRLREFAWGCDLALGMWLSLWPGIVVQLGLWSRVCLGLAADILARKLLFGLSRNLA